MSQDKTTSLLVDEEQLSLDLIEAQYFLKNTRDQNNAKSVVILVNGIELAGKGEAVKQLREWVDPRYLQVKADPPMLLSEQQPFLAALCTLYSGRGADYGDVWQLVQ